MVKVKGPSWKIFNAEVTFTVDQLVDIFTSSKFKYKSVEHYLSIVDTLDIKDTDGTLYTDRQLTNARVFLNARLNPNYEV